MISGIDFDLDVDVDVDIDIDADVDVDIDAATSMTDLANAEINKDDVVKNPYKKLQWWQSLLLYFNFVGLPFMFTFTCWIFIWWLCTVISTSVTESYNTNFGYTLMLAGILPSLFLTKLFTTPFKGFFKNLNPDGDAPINFIGRKGVSLSKISGDKMGSVEVLVDNSPMTIYSKSIDGEPITYKQDILIVKQANDKTFYWVTVFKEEALNVIDNIEDIKL
jgi:hypothetical protein